MQVHNQLAIRWSFPFAGASSFPASVPDDFVQALQGRQPSERVVGLHKMDEGTLQQLAARNPVASTISFDFLIENIRDNLLCATSRRKADSIVAERAKGIFGTALCNHDVKETNKRGSLHVHGQHHGGALPALIADVASDAELRAEVIMGLDDQFCAELPLEYHAMQIALKVLRVGARRDAAFSVPLPPEDLRQRPRANASAAALATHRRRLMEEWWPEFRHHALMVVANRHVHEHCGTCLHGKRGKTGCRMACSWGHDVEETRCVQLRPLTLEHNEAVAGRWETGAPQLADVAPAGYEHRCRCCHADGALHSTAMDPIKRERALAEEAERRDLYYRYHCLAATYHTF